MQQQHCFAMNQIVKIIVSHFFIIATRPNNKYYLDWSHFVVATKNRIIWPVFSGAKLTLPGRVASTFLLKQQRNVSIFIFHKLVLGTFYSLETLTT